MIGIAVIVIAILKTSGWTMLLFILTGIGLLEHDFGLIWHRETTK